MRCLLLLILIVSGSFSYTQEWIKFYGNSQFSCWPDNIVEFYDKGYIILGTKLDAKYGWIIKTNINGDVLWEKKLGNGQYLIFPHNIENTTDNGLVIGGSIRKYGNQNDAFILKLNSCGELDWCSVIHTPTIPDDIGWKVKPSADNGYVLLGEFNYPSDNIRTNLFKFDSLGSLIWHQYYLPDSLLFGEDGFDLTVDSLGTLITTEGYFPDPGQGGGWLRPYYIRTDNDGLKIWELVYTDNGYYHGGAYNTLIDSHGNYYSAGRHHRGNGDSPALIKVMNDGTGSYNADFKDSTDLGGANTINILDDTILIIGASWKFFNGYHPSGLFKSDTNGNLLKEFIFPNPDIGGVYGATITFDQKYICASHLYVNPYLRIAVQKFNSDLEYDSIYSIPYIYDSLCFYPIVSDTIDPDCGLIVSVQDPMKNPDTFRLKVYPNPASSFVTVAIPEFLEKLSGLAGFQTTTIYHKWGSAILEVYDLFGRKVIEQTVFQGAGNLDLDVSKWQSGMYVFRLSFRGETVATEKVVVN